MKKTLVYLSVVLAIFSAIYMAYADHTVYVENLLDAIAESENTNKDVLVIFTADWCGACKVMKKDIQRHPEVVENYVVCLIDYDTNQDLVKEYKVKTIPDYFVLKNKQEIKRRKGYGNITKFKEWLKNDE